MPTLMKEQTFDRLVEVRRDFLHQAVSNAAPEQAGPMDVFVPWAGHRLTEDRGIYYIGIGLAADAARGNLTFQEALADTESFCGNGPHKLGHTPFWQFLNRLTQELLGGPYHSTAARWGWSNLLKIGWSEGQPAQWPAELKAVQRDVCSSALQEEFAQLRQSLVFVGSYEEFGILSRILPGKEAWNKEHEKTAGLWWLHDSRSGNL